MSTKETQPSVESTQPKVKLTPFGTPVRECKPTRSDKIYKKEIAQFGLELDQKTGSTVVVSKDPLDLDALIQSYKDQCGMEMAQLMIKRGLASTDDFAAKPGDYGDTSTLPDNLNDAYQAAQVAQKAAGNINLSQFKSDKDIQDYVNKVIAQQLAAQQAQAKAQVQTDNGGKQ